MFPGLVRHDEVVAPGPITHAFRVATRATNGYVWPASHEAGDTPGAPPLGTRLRLKASKDISGYPPEVRKIFQAMKTYGLIIADNGGNMYRHRDDGSRVGQRRAQSRVPQSLRR